MPAKPATALTNGVHHTQVRVRFGDTDLLEDRFEGRIGPRVLVRSGAGDASFPMLDGPAAPVGSSAPSKGRQRLNPLMAGLRHSGGRSDSLFS